MTNKLFSSILLAGLGLSLVACSNNTNNNTSTRTSSSAISQETTRTSQTATSTNQIQNQSDDEAAVLDILDQISKASIARDVDALEAILPDNYVLIHMTGYKQPKSEWLEEVRSGSMEYFDGNGNSTSNQTVTIDGDTATVSSKGTVEAKIGTGGTRRSWTISSTATFKKLNGQWVIQETDATR